MFDESKQKVWHENCLLYAAVLTPWATGTAGRYAQGARGRFTVLCI